MTTGTTGADAQPEVARSASSGSYTLIFTLPSGEQVYTNYTAKGHLGPDVLSVYGVFTNGTKTALASDGIVSTADGWVQGTKGPGVKSGYSLTSVSEFGAAVNGYSNPALFTINVAFSQVAPKGAAFIAEQFADLYATNGTSAGTVKLDQATASIIVGASSLQPGDTITTDAYYQNLGDYGNLTLVEGYAMAALLNKDGGVISSSTSIDILVTNGTVAGTHIVSATADSVSEVGYGVNDALIFSVYGESNDNLDSENGATGALSTLVSGAVGEAFQYLSTLGNDEFVGTTGVDAGVLYATDGTSANTVAIATAPSGEVFQYVATSLGRDLFSTEGGTTQQIYVADGTENGTHLVATATSGETFQVTQDALKTTVAILNGSNIVERFWIDEQTGLPETAGDEYVWVGPVSGDWGTSADWEDATTGADPAKAPPAAGSSVTINATPGGGVQVITGTGTCEYLSINGSTSLQGQFSTGALSVEAGTTLYAGDTLSVANNATIGNSVDFGISINGVGSEFIVGGTLNFGNPSGFGFGYTVSAADGALVRLGGLNFLQEGANITVDATSSVEVGTAGGVSAGSFAVDAGETVAITSTYDDISAPNVVLNGIISVTGGAEIATGSLSGTGQMQIGLNSSLSVGASYSFSGITGGSGITIAFTESGGSLDIGTNSLDSSQDFEPVIAGFGSSDVIDWYGALTGVMYASGTLTLKDGTDTVAKLNLSGNFVGDTFLAVPLTEYNTTQIDILGGGDTKKPPAGTKTSDTYVWNGPVAGSWDLAANWEDTATGANPAQVAPGAHDAVTINAANGGGVQVITGTGNSTSLTINGATVLYGQFSTGALSVEAGTTLYAGDTLSVANNATIGNSVDFGISINGVGSEFIVGGTLNFGNPSGFGFGYTVSAADGALVRLGGLNFLQEGANITVDATSSVEVGTAGGVSAGSFAVDAGETVAITSTYDDISAPNVVLNGIISVTGGAEIATGSLSGTGQMQIGLNSSLSVGASYSFSGITGGSGITIAFTESGGSLDIGTNSLDSSQDFEPVIAGFGSSDVIDYGGTITSAAYASGILTLLDGSSSVATLQLSGNYSGESFLTTPVGSYETQISLYNVPGNAPPIITAPATLSAEPKTVTPISGVSIADSDAGSAHETLTAVIIDTYGLLYANKSASGGGGTITGSGTKDLIISGNLTQVNADLTSLTFTSSTLGSDNILIAANDGRGGTDNAAIAVTVGDRLADFGPRWLQDLRGWGPQEFGATNEAHGLGAIAINDWGDFNSATARFEQHTHPTRVC